jgi:hypothetical protein
MAVLAVWTSSSSIAAPLPADMQMQADTFIDGGHFDQPALYPLLRDATSWPRDPREAAVGAVVPDLTELHDEPADFRGTLLLIEARLAGRTRSIDLLRNGPWPNPITEWGIQLNPHDSDRPAVLLLVGDGSAAPTRANATVRLPARFLGLWGDTDSTGSARRFPVFVSSMNAVETTSTPDHTSFNAAIPIVALTALAALIVFRLRRYTRRKPRSATPSPSIPLQDDAERPAGHTPLPTDPAEALRELDIRNR